MFFSKRRLAKRNKRLRELIKNTGQHAFQLALQYTGNTDEAKDIVQQSLVKAMETLRLPENNLNYWFLRTVRNTALDYTRHLKTRQRLSTEIKVHEEQLRSSCSQSLVLSEQQANAKTTIHNSLQSLSNEHREIIVLKDLHDYSYEQIAKILDISKGTVMSRLHRARSALKDEVLKHERI